MTMQTTNASQRSTRDAQPGAALSVRAASVNYGAVRALRDVSIEIQPGEVRAIVGPNGAGKTTLTRLICGLVRPVSGTVFLDGRDVTRASVEARGRQGLSLVPEGRGVFTSMSLTDNLLVAAGSTKTGAERLRQTFELFPTFARMKDRKAGLLSGGEQQLLALARALMTQPKVLVLDEPSMGLSPVAVKGVMDVLARLGTSGPAILLVEQNTRLAIQLADFVYVLQHGSVIVSGPTAEIAIDEVLREVYLGERGGRAASAGTP